MSLLVLDGTGQNFTKLIQTFAMEKKNFFFYAVTTIENELTWHQVIALGTGISVNRITFLENSIIDDSYFDLNGLKIRSVDLDWEPYVSVSDCEEDNVGCTVKGFTVDMVDLIATQLNFTYNSTKVKSFHM